MVIPSGALGMVSLGYRKVVLAWSFLMITVLLLAGERGGWVEE